ncbi:MAG TPA: acyl-CoA thioesterase [Flavisolibacter sp.]|nr:acyl-CoA thioesterase [Flavisolibacter sp.]
MKKVLESNLKVLFHDCDPFNHLNNSRYIDYIMAARTDQLEEAYQLDVYKIAQEQGVGWVSAQTQISYLFPAFLGEAVKIQTRLLAATEKSLVVEGVMLNGDGTVLKAVMWAKLVHFNLKMQRSVAHSQALSELFQKIVQPLNAETSFEDRVKVLKFESAGSIRKPVT